MIPHKRSRRCFVGKNQHRLGGTIALARFPSGIISSSEGCIVVRSIVLVSAHVYKRENVISQVRAEARKSTTRLQEYEEFG